MRSTASTARSRWGVLAAWVALLVVALAVRLPFVLRVGPNEGGGDEWYAMWRSWSVLFESGRPVSFLHPALFYDVGAALFAGSYALGKLSGAWHAPVDLLADFVRHEARYLQALQVLAAVCGALTVPVVFELARRLSGWTAGLVAGGILAVLPVHVGYSQRARVDTLCVLLTAGAALALHRVVERGERRDFVLAGIVIGLATAANYPAAALVVPYAAAAWLARAPNRAGSFALGLGAAALAFALTNPYVVLAPTAAWQEISLLLSFTARQHPFMEKAADWSYLRLLRDQSDLFAILAAVSGIWLVLRGPGFRRVLGLFPWLVIGAFVASTTQEDRYVLLVLPWMCVAVGLLFGDATAWSRSTMPRRALVTIASLLLLAPTVLELWTRTRPLVFVEPVEQDQRAVLQHWLLEHTPPGATIWVEADRVPLLQATFADPGGRLQQRMQEAVQRAYPTFQARVLKGEVVERIANFDPRLITEKQVQLVMGCDRNVQYAESAGDDFAAPRAFYAAVAEHGTRRIEAMGCAITEIQ
jgi:asparagine N-glycosylation enzyme membrane subunit Stt3